MLSIDVLALAEKIAAKYQQNEQKKTFNAVMLAMYSLGGDTGETVGLSELTQKGLTKLQVFNATQEGIDRGLIEDRGAKIDMPFWGLNRRGRLYSEALVEESR